MISFKKQTNAGKILLNASPKEKWRFVTDLNHLLESYKDKSFILTMTIFSWFLYVFRIELWNSQALVAHALGEYAWSNHRKLLKLEPGSRFHYYVLSEHTHHSSLKDNLSSHCHIPYSPEADAYCTLLACSVNPEKGKHNINVLLMCTVNFPKLQMYFIFSCLQHQKLIKITKGELLLHVLHS